MVGLNKWINIYNEKPSFNGWIIHDELIESINQFGEVIRRFNAGFIAASSAIYAIYYEDGFTTGATSIEESPEQDNDIDIECIMIDFYKEKISQNKNEFIGDQIFLNHGTIFKDE